MPGVTFQALLMPAPAAGGGLTSVAFEASAVSTGATITGPAAIQAGDVLLMFDRPLSIGAPTKVVPTDFTEVPGSEISDGNARCVLSYKIADGSEASASITGMDGALSDNKVLLVFRPDAAASALNFADVAAQVTNANPTAQVVNASGGAAPLIVIAVYGSNGTVNPRTSSPAMDAEVNSSTGFYVGYKVYNASPADHTVDMDDEGSSNNLHSYYVEVS